MAALAATLLPLAPIVIPSVVKFVEWMFGAGTGKIKIKVAPEIAQAILTALHGEGQPIEEIAAAVQETVDLLNSKGELKGTETVIDRLTFSAGQLRALRGGLEITKATIAMMEASLP